MTTDHGGLGTSHDDEVADVLETFVVVWAPGRVPAASGWPTASPLDVAPRRLARRPGLPLTRAHPVLPPGGLSKSRTPRHRRRV